MDIEVVTPEYLEYHRKEMDDLRAKETVLDREAVRQRALSKECLARGDYEGSNEHWIHHEVCLEAARVIDIERKVRARSLEALAHGRWPTR